MVHWNELSDFLKSNPFQTYGVKPLHSMDVCRQHVEHFPIFEADVEPSVPTSISISVTVPPVPPVPPTKPVVVPVVVPVVASPVVRMTPKRPDVLKYTLDPVVLGIEHREVLYNDSPKASKRQIEIDEALRCESRIDELYKSQGGRSRGWTKTMLEAAIRPRCASGGNLHELKQAKSVFLWQMAGQDKATSGFLDFLCVAKQIQVAIWNDEHRTVTVYPAADYIGDGAISATARPFYNVLDSGLIMKSNGVRTGGELVTFASTHGWTLLPPPTVIHSLEKLTLNDLESVGKKLGMSDVVGSKIERIAAVAGFKLKSRLVAV
jgi:hypothetical protein